MYYKMRYYDGYDAELPIFKEVHCFIEPISLQALLSTKPPDFVRMMVEDGDDMIVRTEHIISFVKHKEVS